MSYDKFHLRHCVLYEYQKGRNSMKFKVGDCDNSNESRFGRPSPVHNAHVMKIIDHQPFLTTSEYHSLSNILLDYFQSLNYSQTFVLNLVNVNSFLGNINIF